jgi:hypothetical protein
MGTISCIYIFNRFCVGRSIIANLKNWFVIRHFIYVFLNVLCLAPMKINEFFRLLDKDFISYECFLIAFGMGFVMFLIRASETNIYKRLCCKMNNADNDPNKSV